MQNIKVSVVVPIYNVEKWLKECLESLRYQTLRDIEIIMVDDGSTDNSKQIAEEYANQLSNFVLICQNNRGLSAARNAGLRLAHGEYICFLDSDDYLAIDALEKLYYKAKRDNIDVLKYSAYMFVDESNEYEWEEKAGYKYKAEYTDICEGAKLLNDFLINDDYKPSCCLMLVKLDLILEKHLSFYEGIIFEDNLFHFQLLSVAKRVAVFNYPLYYRRIRKGSITQTRNREVELKSKSIIISEIQKVEHDTSPSLLFAKRELTRRFFYNFLDNWMELNSSEQFSSGMKNAICKVRPVAKKNQYWHKLDVFIFCLHAGVYKKLKNKLDTLRNNQRENSK